MSVAERETLGDSKTLGDSVDIKVNIVNQIGLFRTATFPDRWTFIDEALQNAQRARASRVDISVESGLSLTIKDDGIGLRHPADIFTIASSGWDAEIVADQKPFGLGFFSCILLANTIVIESGTWRCTMDIPKILEQGVVAIPIEDIDPVEGFTVTLSNFTEKWWGFQVTERVKATAKYIDDFDTYLNGNLVEHIDFTSTDDSPYAMVINEPGIQGWIRPYDYMGDNGFGYHTTIRLFYQKRFVKEVFVSPQLAGIIMIGNDKIDLRAPDRKDIIHNAKWEDLKVTLTEYNKQMLLELVRKADDEALGKYENSISTLLKVHEYKDYLRYTLIDGIDKLDELSGLEDKTKTIDETIEALVNIQEVEVDKTISLVTTIHSEYVGPTKSVASIDDNPTVQAPGIQLPKKFSYWVRKSELADYLTSVRLAVQNGITVVVLKNKLEENAIGLHESIMHIGELDNKETIDAVIYNLGPQDLSEIRATWLLGIIAKAVGLARSPFKIGDIVVEKVTSFGPIEISRDQHKPLGMAYKGVVYIDRGRLLKEGLNQSDSKILTYRDRAFIARNIEVISHELAHHIYNTVDGTLQHSETQIALTSQILTTLFR